MLFRSVEDGEPCFEEAVSVVASFADALARVGGDCSLVLDERILVSGQTPGSADSLQVALATVGPAPSGGFENVARRLRDQLGSDVQVILVLVRLDEPRKALARAIGASGARLQVLVISEASQTPVSDDRADFSGELLRIEPGTAARVL